MGKGGRRGWLKYSRASGVGKPNKSTRAAMPRNSTGGSGAVEGTSGLAKLIMPRIGGEGDATV